MDGWILLWGDGETLDDTRPRPGCPSTSLHDTEAAASGLTAPVDLHPFAADTPSPARRSSWFAGSQRS
jgi:hypothetical protein